MVEINGLHNMECFEITSKINSKVHQLYRYRLVDRVKPNGTKRSRMCAAECDDYEHGLFFAAPTMKRIWFWLLIAVSATTELPLHTRDISEAFVTSKTLLSWPSFMRPPKEMGLPSRIALKVIKLVYGMPEAPLHWLKNFLDYHTSTHEMSQTSLDSCLLFATKYSKSEVIIGVQDDDPTFDGTWRSSEKKSICPPSSQVQRKIMLASGKHRHPCQRWQCHHESSRVCYAYKENQNRRQSYFFGLQ